MKSSNELSAYHRYMIRIAILLGADKETAATEMQEVINFEVSLANVSIRSLSIFSIKLSVHFSVEGFNV